VMVEGDFLLNDYDLPNLNFRCLIRLGNKQSVIPTFNWPLVRILMRNHALFLLETRYSAA